jgi:hypothetical protein
MKKILCLLSMVGGLVACAQNVNFGLPDTSNSFSSAVAYNNKVDIIWVMDNSSSMKQHQATLSQQVPLMVQKLNELKLDYHMAVITSSMGNGGDGGKFVGAKFLTNSTANVGAALAGMLVVGETGGNLERGIDSLLTVLSPSYLNGAGKGFLRNDAFLAVIVLSDEDDQSVRTQKYVTDFMDSIKAKWLDGTSSWNINFIGVLADTPQCRTYNNYSDPGLFYMGLADASNGSKESICSTDYTNAVSNIRRRITQIISDFRLNKLPLVSSITVAMNGQPVPQDLENGWIYIEDKNLIRFNGSYIPAADAVIKIDFTPAQAN